MRARLVQAWEKLSASYWFVPAVMALAAVVLAEGAVRLHDEGGVRWLRELDWLYSNQPEGARALLSTVAGSMITVAGVTFSMTLLAISHASTQMGPRLLTDFMRDRGNQITLGTFISTFIYCLLVLRSVRSAGPEAGAPGAFVPQEAVWLAMMLAIGGVCVLIYFIHHIPEMLSLSNLVERVSRTLQDRIEALYPSGVGEEPEPAPLASTPDGPIWATVAGPGRGYLQYVDDQALLEWGTQHDGVVELRVRPGEFLHPRRVIARIHCDREPEPAALDTLRAAFVRGRERTPRQDVRFPALQIVEVAIRALSPGVNDPLTAIRCIDHLEAALIRFGERRIPEARRLDGDGQLRLIARPVDFAEFADTVLDGLRPHVQGDSLCGEHLSEALERVARSLEDGPNRRHVMVHRAALLEGALAHIDDERTLDRLRRAAARSPGEIDHDGQVV